MTPPDRPTTSRDPSAAPTATLNDPRVAAVIEEFVDRLRAGGDANPYQLVLDHPTIAAELERRLPAILALVGGAGSAPAAAPDRPPPATVGRYRVECELGRGASAVVYRAYDPKFDRRVALKVLAVNPTDRPADTARFLQAARAQAALRHENIVPVHEVGEADGLHYLDMELVEGETLDVRLRRPPGPSFREAAQMVHQVARALHFAHQHGVIHRDVKPSNILIDARGEPQVADFGLARRVGIDAALTVTGSPLGTPAYMPPEQAAGKPHEADARSDVYSLGVVFYRLLTGRLPFDGGSVAEVYRQIEAEEPPPPRRVRPDVPADLETICLRALEKRPADRFATAGAFAEELWRWLHDEPLTVRRPTWVERARRWLRRQQRAVRWLLVMTGLLFAASAVLGWAALALHERAATANAAADLARTRQDVEAEARATVDAWAAIDRSWQRVRSPEAGRRIETREELRKLADLRRQISDKTRRERIDDEARSVFAASLGVPDISERPEDRIDVTNSAFHLCSAAIHPDGQWLAVGTPSRPVRWDRGQRPELPRIPDGRSRQSRLAFSPDGKYLAFAPAGGGLSVWDGAVSRWLGDLEPPGAPEVLAVGYSAAADALWACRTDGLVRSWSLKDLAPAGEWSAPDGVPWTAARFSDGAGRLAVGGPEGQVRVYDSGGGQLVRTLPDPEGRLHVDALAWEPGSGNPWLAVGTRDGRVEVWDDADRLVHHWSPFTAEVGRLEFLPAPRRLLAGARGSGFRLWDIATGDLVVARSGYAIPSNFARDGRRFAGCAVGAVSFGQLLPTAEVVHLRGHQSAIERLAWSKDGHALASLDGRYEVRVWDVCRSVDTDRFRAPPGDVVATNAWIALSDDSRSLAYASGGTKKSTALIRDVTTHSDEHFDLPGGFERLASDGPGRFLLVREEFETGKRLRTVVRRLQTGQKSADLVRVIRPSLPGDEEFFESGLTTDGRYYWWTGPRRPAGNRRVEVRRVDDGKDCFSQRWHDDVSDLVAYLAPTGRLWVWCGGEHRLFEPASGKEVPAPEMGPEVVSPNGAWEARRQKDDRRGHNVCALRRAGTDRPWVTFAADDLSYPRAMGFSPDGRYFAFGATSGTITVIDLPALETAVARFEQGDPAE